MGLLQTLRNRLAVHRKHLLDNELKREQALASRGEDEPPSAGVAGATLNAQVGEVQTERVEHPVPAQNEDVDQRPEV